jgi:hypothetical protein
VLTVPLFGDAPNGGKIRVSFSWGACYEFTNVRYGQDLAVPPRQGIDPGTETPCPAWAKKWAEHAWAFDVAPATSGGGAVAVGYTNTYSTGQPPVAGDPGSQIPCPEPNAPDAKVDGFGATRDPQSGNLSRMVG